MLLLLIRCFLGFVLPVLESCSAVWRSAADTHLRLFDRVARAASFLPGGVPGCNLSNHQSIVFLCMVYTIRSNLLHPLCDALPVAFVLVRVARVALDAYWYSSVPRCWSTEGLLYLTQSLFGTNLVSLVDYLSVFDY